MSWAVLFPPLRWRQRISRSTLQSDAVAGLTGAVVLVPQGVAFATIAGMPAEYGLYAAMLPAVIAALWGSSWHLVSGPTTAISLVVFATLSPLAAPESADFIRLALTLTFLIGVVQLALGLLRLGKLVNFVSHTVVVGFTAGAALLIAASQVRNFFGIAIPRGAAFHEVVNALLTQLPAINPFVLGVAVSTVAASALVRRLRPRWPYMIFGMAAGALTAALINSLFGLERTKLHSIGALQIGLPPLTEVDLSLGTVAHLLPIAAAVALLALTEAVSIARAVAVRSNQRIDGNQEFIGQGLSNLAGAFFSGYASSGSFNRTGLNFASGAQTPLAAVFSAVFLLLIVMFLAPLAMYLPTAAMAGILFVVAWGLLDWQEIRKIVQASGQEAAVLAATFVATLTVQLEFAIYFGVLLSLGLYLRRTAQPHMEDAVAHPLVHPPVFSAGSEATTHPELKIVRLNGSIFFGAVDHLREQFERLGEQPGARHLLVVASGINFIDYAGAQLLAQEAKRRRTGGGALYFFNLKDEPMQMLRSCGVDATVGIENFFALGSDPVGAITARTGHAGAEPDAGDGRQPSLQTPSLRRSGQHLNSIQELR